MGGTTKKDAGLSMTQPLDNTQWTPNLFSPHMQYMPEQYFGDKPVQDPTNILNAYMMHMPEFLKAARSEAIPKAPVAQATPQAQQEQTPKHVGKPWILEDFFNSKG